MRVVEVTGHQHLKLLDPPPPPPPPPPGPPDNGRKPNVPKGGSAAGDEEKVMASSLAAVREDEAANATRFGCQSLRVQCRGEERHVTIHRSKTFGQHTKSVVGGIGVVFGAVMDIATMAAVHEARQDAFNGGGMTGMNMHLVHQHGLFGPIRTEPITYDPAKVACSNIKVNGGNGKIEASSLSGTPAGKQLAEWPSADALAKSACEAMEMNLDAYNKHTIKAYLNACVQHSSLCGNKGLCFYAPKNKFTQSDGKECPASLLDIGRHPVPAGGVLLAKSFGRPNGPDFAASGDFVKASWGRHDSETGVVIALQDLQLGERCIMTLNPKQVTQKFSNLLAPRGIVALPHDYQVHMATLTKKSETGKPSGCTSWGNVRHCTEGFVICGVAKTSEKCGRFSKEHQHLCCPSVIIGATVHKSGVLTIASLAKGTLASKAASHLGAKAIQVGDVVLAVGGAGLKPGECVTRGATVPLMKNWMFGSTEMTLWLGRKEGGASQEEELPRKNNRRGKAVAETAEAADEDDDDEPAATAAE